MNGPATARNDVVSFLQRNGWSADGGGLIGEMWRRRSNNEESAIAVPYDLFYESPEFRGIAARVASLTRTATMDIVEEIEREFQDIQNFRIGDKHITEESVLLESAATMLTAARRMIRAAATTAHKPRPHIGSNFSAHGDKLASLVRLSHTRRGSFVLPVVMPVEPPEVNDDEVLGESAVVEPGERRVTRTLATALVAIDRIVIQPEREPTVDALFHLVQAGVSSELVASVRGIAIETGIELFDIDFRWAPGLGAPGGIPGRVVIPIEAAPLLARVEKLMKTTLNEITESVSGQIVEIRHVPNDPVGEIAIRTIRNNRNVEIRISTTASVIRDAYDWAKKSRAIIARGLVVSNPGRALSIPDPEKVQPIDELFEHQ